MRQIKGSTTKRTQKLLSGLLVALLLLVTPLPAFADTTPTSTATPATTTTSPATDTPSTTSTPDPTTATPVLTLSANPSPSASPELTSTQQVPTGTPPVTVADTPPTSSTTITGQNQVNSTATSGNATVSDNKKAGSATSGDATANATVVNVANSNTNFGSGNNFTYFSKDIYDQNADVTIDPTALMQGGAAGNTSTGDLQTAVSLTDILNNIALSAQSGDATVSGNKKAGDATSGDASALANVINIVGSTISAQQSFLGIVNIYGNLKGNILVPQSFVDSLVNSTPADSQGNSDTAIDNTINASATSGDATVSGNKKAGDATSGDAMTNLMVYNLTGQEVVAKNSLLVFVNVLGKWVGMIVQAPGSNTAILGKDATTAATQDSNDSNSSGSSTTHITNNISVSAASGDAAVTDNKKAGGATSGNAAAGVNLVNITNSNFKLGDWFGALFINVLGSWIGDFGIKNDIPAPTGTTGSDPTDQSSPGQQAVEDVRIFRFDSEAPVTPLQDDSDQSQTNDIDNERSVAFTASTDDKSSGAVLGASTSSNGPQTTDTARHGTGIDTAALVAIIGALTLLIALGSLAARRRFAAN